VLLCEERARPSRWGSVAPALEPIHALRYHFPRMYARMAEVIQVLGGGSLLSTPTEADLAGVPGEDIRRYFQGAGGVPALERIRLLKLAWDAAGDGFAQRQIQYERYHAGDPVRLAAAQYLGYDASALHETVRRAIRDESAADLAPALSPNA
jgi:aromatic ring hydroxylase